MPSARRPLAQTISQQTGISRRPVKMIVAAVNVLDRRFRQLVRIDIVEQRDLDSVEYSAQRLGHPAGEGVRMPQFLQK